MTTHTPTEINDFIEIAEASGWSVSTTPAALNGGRERICVVNPRTERVARAYVIYTDNGSAFDHCAGIDSPALNLNDITL